MSEWPFNFNVVDAPSKKHAAKQVWDCLNVTIPLDDGQ